MNRIAIIVAASEYQNGIAKLPGCKSDLEIFHQLLISDGRFNEILKVGLLESSSHVKRKISDFVDSFRSKAVDEVIFYFSGHGEYFENEFYYLLEDFDEKKRRQTSLLNSEIDNQIRSLNPEIFVKFVDACQAGINYIKSPDQIDSYLKSNSQSFRKLYFFFSSQSNQSSYQDDKYSYFTSAVTRAVCDSENDNVRYTEVSSFVADYFENLGIQTPYFVTQADHTEIFVGLDRKAKDRILGLLAPPTLNTSTGLAPPKLGLTAVLKERSEVYCTKDDAMAFLNRLPQQLEAKVSLGELQDVFEMSIATVETSAPAPSAIGKWLQEKDDEIGYFCKEKIGLEKYMRPSFKNTLSALAKIDSIYNFEKNQEFVEDTRSVVQGYQHTWDTPYDHILVRLENKFPAVAPEACFIVPVVSRTMVRLFWANSHFEYTDWETTRRSGSIKWATDACQIKDTNALGALIEKIIREFTDFVRVPLEQRWLNTPTEEAL